MKLHLLLLPILLIVSSAAVLAGAPGTPHQFYGNVITNGHPAVDGLLVTAQIDGKDVAATVTSGGSYGMRPDLFYITDPQTSVTPIEPARAGKTITFYVNGVEAADYVFVNGESTNLDLSVTGDFPDNGGDNDNNDGGSTNTGSRTSSPSGGSPTITTTTEDTTDDTIEVVLGDEPENTEPAAGCEPNWYCSDWLDCVNNVQKRVCTDSNSCGSIADKPATERACTTVEEGEDLSLWDRFWNSLFGGDSATGEAVGTSGTGSIVAVILVVLVIAAVIVYGVVRNNRQPKKRAK